MNSQYFLDLQAYNRSQALILVKNHWMKIDYPRFIIEIYYLIYSARYYQIILFHL